MRRAIGATGFKGREIIEALRHIGDGANHSCVDLRIDGVIIAHGDVEEINFVDGGFMVTVKDPRPAPPPPTSIPSAGVPRQDDGVKR